MLSEKKRITALLASLLPLALFISGCNHPAPRTSGSEGDLTVQSISEAPAVSTPTTDAEEDAKPSQTQTPDSGTAEEPQDFTAAVQPADGKSEGQQNTPEKAGPAPGKTPGQQNTPAAVEAPPAKANSQPNTPATAVPSVGKTIAQPAPKRQPTDTAEKSAASPTESSAPKETETVTRLTFQDLYSDVTVRGVKISDKVNRLSGQKVEMIGYMAPPLTAQVRFFVLTKVALTICPFCSTDADWPTDIVVVFMPEGKEITPTEHQVKVTGTLSVGSQTDEETGFVSLIRIMADQVEVLK
ncbi:hypothetical protein [Brevibacillus massiliensis]|uniref:hypothetical protein n=1 Tax=Brevibacillus massiliensis TaxID=1118054 RepID=UPI0002DD26F7|nr:hypothetical protein [Brevibacillus massiliensis]